ncbi:MAG: flagellar basal-body MS-ring/collar protein FliF [Rhodobacteraceae bacterium]|nr:flagellar basal-body MS-ring/collar protein FliF [Paracoccaceae bacterium]
MQQIRNVWAGLDGRRRAIVILATIGVFASVLALSRLAATPSMSLLYAGLETSAAGEVVRALEQNGAAYDVRGGSIYVDATKRDQLRMTLASEGLPATGGRGYELLDSLSGFGTTSQMFDAAYWRAKEGELARTIVASASVAQARVHIANSGTTPFARSAQPTASVAITATGAPISAAQAKAFRHLVASAVAGLSADDVTVIDSSGGLIGSNDATAPTPLAQDKAQVLRDRVQRLVEARVGPGNAVVEVSVDTVTETESIRERRFDPDSRVAVSTDTEERSNTSSDAGGDVTVASNLPDGDAANGAGGSAETSETRERVNYEVSETEREVLRAPGAVKRLSVAVLVNGLPQNGPDAQSGFVPRPDAELAALRDLVASAVGFDEARGDVITLRSMDLPAIAPLGTPASQSFLDGFSFDPMALVQMAVLALVTLILGLFVVRPILAKAPEGTPFEPAALPPGPRTVEAGPDAPEMAALTGEIADSGDAGFGDGLDMGVADFASLASADADPVERLRHLIGQRQEETVEILRSWLEEEDEETAR